PSAPSEVATNCRILQSGPPGRRERGRSSASAEPTVFTRTFTLMSERDMATKDIQYRGHKLIARQYANGWQIEIVPLQPGQVTQTTTFQELADAVNEAKKIVDANRKIPN